MVQDLTLEELKSLRDKAHKKATQAEDLPKNEKREDWVKLEKSISSQLPFFEKLTDGKTFLRWSLFKTMKELERQLNSNLGRTDFSQIKQIYFMEMLRETTAELARTSNPLFEAEPARSEMRDKVSILGDIGMIPGTHVNWKDGDAQIRLDIIFEAIGKKLGEIHAAGSGYVLPGLVEASRNPFDFKPYIGTLLVDFINGSANPKISFNNEAIQRPANIFEISK